MTKTDLKIDKWEIISYNELSRYVTCIRFSVAKGSCEAIDQVRAFLNELCSDSSIVQGFRRLL